VALDPGRAAVVAAPRVEELGDNPVYAFLATAPTPVLVLGSVGIIDYVNGAACAAFGYQPSELLGRSVETLLPHDGASGEVRRRVELMTDPSSRLVGEKRHFSVRRKDGTVFSAEMSLIPVQWSGQDLVVAALTDISGGLEQVATLDKVNRAYLTLARMNQVIVRAPDALSLFEQTCRVAVDQGGFEGAWVGKRSDGHRVRCVASAGTLDEYVEQVGASTDPDDPRGRGPTGRVFRDGTSYYGQQFLADEATLPWHHLGAAFGIKATATLPLRCAGEVLATLTLYSTRAHVFSGEVRALLEGMAENVSFALESFDSTARLRSVARERTELSRRLVAAQESERARIAADVHDNSVQALAALDLRLGLLKRQLIERAPDVAESLDQLHQTVGIVSAGLRDLLFELEPAGPDTHLVAMLEEAAAHMCVDWTAECSVTVDLADWDQVSSLSPTDRGQALRIVKEALFNARKHSGASHVDVSVKPGADGVDVAVTDDGCGYDARSTSAPGHRGLADMLDRALVSGGWCRIESDAGGTSVRFWMPYCEPAPRDAPSPCAEHDLHPTPPTEVESSPGAIISEEYVAHMGLGRAGR
jgi:PAS domain S-box-containing protein